MVAAVAMLTPQTAAKIPQTPIEAMAHRRPVVAFDVGGIREWLQDGSTGFAVPRGDTVSMARAIRMILNNSDMAVQMGQAGRDLVNTRFRSAEHIAGLVSAFDAARIRWDKKPSNSRYGLTQPAS